MEKKSDIINVATNSGTYFMRLKSQFRVQPFELAAKQQTLCLVWVGVSKLESDTGGIFTRLSFWPSAPSYFHNVHLQFFYQPTERWGLLILPPRTERQCSLIGFGVKLLAFETSPIISSPEPLFFFLFVKMELIITSHSLKSIIEDKC